jgi:hypothetical protein
MANRQSNLATADFVSEPSQPKPKPDPKVVAFKPKNDYRIKPDNNIGNVVQKSAQLGKEVANFAGRDKLAGKFGAVKDFATAQDPVKNPTEGNPVRDTEAQTSSLQGSPEDKKFIQKFLQGKEILDLAEEIAEMTGYEDVAEMLEMIEDGIYDGTLSAEDLKNGDAGAIRDRLATKMGNRVSKIAQGKGFGGKKINDKLGLGTVSAGAGAALGGAATAAFEGKGVVGIAQSATSWYVLWFAVGSLITPWSPLALLYLNFHYVASKWGSKGLKNWFSKPSLSQRVIIIGSDLVYLIAIPLLFLTFMSVGCNWPIINNRFTGYRLSVIGLYIGEDCKHFDMSYFATGTTVSPTSTPPSIPAAPVVPRP